MDTGSFADPKTFRGFKGRTRVLSSQWLEVHPRFQGTGEIRRAITAKTDVSEERQEKGEALPRITFDIQTIKLGS